MPNRTARTAAAAAALVLSLGLTAGAAAAQPLAEVRRAEAAGAAVLSPTTDRWRDYATRGDARAIETLDRERARLLRLAERRSSRATAPNRSVLDPATAVRLIPPGSGAYRCRSIQLTGAGEVYAYGWFQCRIALSAGGSLSLTKLTGSQRVAGQLFPFDPRASGPQTRLAFLGAQALGTGERGWPRYGADPTRDQAGVLEQLGRDRYRLVIPARGGMEVLELQHTGR